MLATKIISISDSPYRQTLVGEIFAELFCSSWLEFWITANHFTDFYTTKLFRFCIDKWCADRIQLSEGRTRWNAGPACDCGKFWNIRAGAIFEWRGRCRRYVQRCFHYSLLNSCAPFPENLRIWAVRHSLHFLMVTAENWPPNFAQITLPCDWLRLV